MSNTPPALAKILIFLALAAMLATGVVAAEGETFADIRINLPTGMDPNTAIEPLADRVLLTLPGEAVFPLDLVTASGGLLKSGEVTQLDSDRVRVEIILGRAKLERVLYDSEGFVLRFVDRAERGGDGAEPSSARYLLGADDRIIITVHNQPEMNSQLTISPDGTITVPMLGDVRAKGLSPRELANVLMLKLAEEYLVDPQVDVEVEAYRSQWVMVAGQLRVVGRIPLRGGTRLKEVLSEAGGFDEMAGEEITISRRQRNGDSYDTLSFPRIDFENGVINPVLYHGDIIDVPLAKYCYVQGEVRSSIRRVRIERDMSLLRAISLVGGLTDWADRKSVKIRYEGGVVKQFNLTKIQNGKHDDPPLKGGEIIVVPRRFF